MSIADLRREYERHGLLEHEVHGEPMGQFARWFEAAREAGVLEPNAMVLATSDRSGRPSARVVLLKGLDERGFGLFTNQESRKARELEVNPHGALVFFWPELERQVRAEGTVEAMTAAEADGYWAKRPRESQLGAWASPQSQRVGSRGELEANLAAARARFGDGAPVPRPPHWGGYLLRPDAVEFWQGRPARLHDRLIYRRSDSGWSLARLAP
ncbi:MAG: pyridoxamine 5'-phosphate oxidase [Planctomycetaceae bacterium]|nr:pyridoxamine 5'-phosphate oxidase [Planctomycetaceae bacterium]